MKKSGKKKESGSFRFGRPFILHRERHHQKEVPLAAQGRKERFRTKVKLARKKVGVAV